MKLARCLTLSVTLFSLLTPTVFATLGSPVGPTPSGGDPNPPANLQLPDNPLPNGGNDIISIISIIANWVYSFLLVAAVIFILIAAFNYLTGAGNTEKISKAHKILIYAVVAVAIALLAKGIVVLISSLIVSTPVVFPNT